MDWPVHTNVTSLGAKSSGLPTISVGLLVHDDGEVRLSANALRFERLACDINRLLQLLVEVFALPGVPWTALQLIKDYAPHMHVDSRSTGNSIALAIGT